MESIINLLIAYSAYVIATASPGPATLAIMGTAMARGRRSALVFAAGVFTGSMAWAIAAFVGIASVLTSYVTLFYVLKWLGGLYLLWLAYKSFRAALTHQQTKPPTAATDPVSLRALYLRGLALHLTNPKAVVVWGAIVALAVPQGATVSVGLAIMSGCWVLGMMVFGGYALLFSTAKAQAGYRRLGGWFNGIVSGLFGLAGIRLLLSGN